MARYNKQKDGSSLPTGLLIMALLVSLWGRPAPSLAAVKIREKRLVLPSYQVERPSIFPIFYRGRAYQGAKGVVYPYPLLDKLTDQRIARSYRAIFLENKYLKICVIPELGGKIFSIELKEEVSLMNLKLLKATVILGLTAGIVMVLLLNFSPAHDAPKGTLAIKEISVNPEEVVQGKSVAVTIKCSYSAPQGTKFGQ